MLWILEAVPEVHLEGESARVRFRHGPDGQRTGRLDGEVAYPIARLGSIEKQDLGIGGLVAVSQTPTFQAGRLRRQFRGQQTVSPTCCFMDSI